MEARKRAKESRPKEKKDSIISIEAIEKLEREMKKKDVSSSIPLTSPPVLQP
jgi:hypothetical protein